MAKLCLILAALLVFSSIALTHSEPIASFDLARSQRWLMEKQAPYDTEGGETQVSTTPQPDVEEPNKGILQIIKGVVLFIPKQILVTARWAINSAISVANSIITMVEKWIVWIEN